jgi:3-hydroxyisobutyrate dehydrogenase
MTSVAFLGTGTMGLPMARNLMAAGFGIRAWNRSADRARALAEDGADVFEDHAQAVDGADIVVTMLSNADAVLDTASAFLDSVSDGATWIQMSTIGIEGTERCGELAQRAGVAFVDAPVLGTRQPAEKGALVILASGAERTHAVCDPVFEAIGSRTLWLGEVGMGTRLKVVVNSWIVGVVAVLAETVSLADALDIDPKQFFDAVDGGPLDLPYARNKGSAMIERKFEDASFRLALSRKDTELVLSAASKEGLELPVMQAVLGRQRRAEEGGHGDEDMAATYWATGPGAG